MTAKEFNIILEQIYEGLVTVDNLPDELYVYYATRFNASLYSGYGKTLTKLAVNSPEYNLVNSLRGNLNLFSGCKTYHQIAQSQELIFTADGTIRPFKQYRENVKDLDALFRKNWLKTERNTTVSQAQSAAYWQDIEENKDVLPYLQYSAIIDAVTREEHVSLNGIIRKVDDDFWGAYMPPNGYNCRCDVIQLEKGEEKELMKEQKEDLKKVDPLFRMNPAKDGYIFKNEGKGVHPYFKVPEAFEVRKNANFNFPSI